MQVIPSDLDQLKAESSSRPAPNDQQVNEIVSQVTALYTDVNALRKELGTRSSKHDLEWLKNEIQKTASKAREKGEADKSIGKDMARQHEITLLKESIETINKNMLRQADLTKIGESVSATNSRIDKLFSDRDTPAKTTSELAVLRAETNVLTSKPRSGSCWLAINRSEASES